MHTEDGYIIRKCLEGDQSAFGFLVDKYKGSVYAQAYAKLRNFHDAEDVAQEAFIIAYRKLHTLRQYDNIMAWLYSITSNLCKLRIRSQSRRPDSEFIEDQDQDILDQPSINYYQEASIFESTNDALNSLPDIHREILSLHYLAGMKVMDMAKFLGISPRTIARRLNDAKSRLKKEVLAMMNTSFEEQKLGAGFTIRIVERIKDISVNPLSQNSVPWGLSLAIGIIMAVLGIGSHLNPINTKSYDSISSAVGEPRVLDVGEFPVDIVKVSNISVISDGQINGNGLGSEAPSLQNALFMAPQAEGGTWTRKADMPTARYYLSTSAVNGKIYAIGGYDNKQNSLSTVEEYDPVANKWTKKNDMPTARLGLSTSVVNGKIYAIGGISAKTFIPLQTIEEYDPVANKWTEKTNMPEARGYLSSSIVNGKIYAIGGKKNNVFSTVFQYDPAIDTWTKKSDMPTPRMWLSTSAVNGKIYAIGGYNFVNGDLSAVEEYDPVMDKWTKKDDMLVAKGCLATSVVDGKIYAIEGIPSPTIEEYDSVTDTWTKKSDIPTARGILSTSAVNGKIYAIGGYNKVLDLASSTVEEYDPGTSGQSINFKGKLPTTWGETKTASIKKGD